MTYDDLDLAVAGGDLHVGRWSADDPGAPVVLAVHGVTANHRCWLTFAEHTGCTVVAPDLRGRGRSNRLGGPAGMTAHADDLAGLLDHLDLPAVHVVGHSMGGFVAAALAERHPTRTRGVTLVDGGLPLPAAPPGTTAEEVLAATIGPAAERLSMTFRTPEDYLDFWRPHPALAPHWSEAVEDYLRYDLDGQRSRVSLDAVRADSGDLLDPATVAARVHALPGRTTFLRAPYGLMAQPGGLYPPDLVDAHRAAFPDVEVRDVPEANHYSVLFAPEAAAVVAATVDRAVTEAVDETGPTG